MEMHDAQDLRARMNRVCGLIRTLEQSAGPEVRIAAATLVQEIISFHGEGLNRMLEVIYETAGQDLVDRLAMDELVGSLLLLHDVHPVPMETRILQAIDGLLPILRTHGATVELRRLSPEGDVSLRVNGECPRCSSSHENLHSLVVETVLGSAPDAAGVTLEGEIRNLPPQGDEFIPITTLRAKP